MSEKKQRVSLRYSKIYKKHGRQKQYVLKYGRPNANGTTSWAKTPWIIRNAGGVPRPVFFAIVNSIYYHVRRIEEDKDFESMEPKLKVALSDAATVCGCECRPNKFNGVTWLVRKRKLIDFAVVDFERHTDHGYSGKMGLRKLAKKLRGRDDVTKNVTKRMEDESGAIMRISIAVLKKSVWKFVPCETLEKYRNE